jgi:hypothetical protein
MRMSVMSFLPVRVRDLTAVRTDGRPFDVERAGLVWMRFCDYAAYLGRHNLTV